jgi:hypothetical protein
MAPKYGRAYLVGALFFVVTNAEAIDDVFGKFTPAELAALTTGQIVILSIRVLAMAGTVLLAYVNQTVARAGQPVFPPTPASGTPPPAGQS